MNKAAELSKTLEQLDVAEGMKVIEKCYEGALYFDVIGDAMCVMHHDGSVNIFEKSGNGIVRTEAFSAANILKVLHRYRPFKEIFKGNIQ